MAKKKHTSTGSARVKKNSWRLGRRNLNILLWVAGGLVVFWLVFGVFLVFQPAPDSIYVFPENPKQGDTVFIRVKTGSGKITGSFENEELVFYRKGKLPEWISFLGVDAAHEPGDYKIYVSTSDTQISEKDIKVLPAEFSSAPVASAPSAKQTGVTQIKAVDNVIKNDNPVLKKILSNFTPEPYFTSPFSFPLSKIEKTGFSFGKFINFAKSKLQHLGVDLKASENTEIYAVNDGKVVATLNLSNYGKTVIIDHGLDIFSLYLHLEEFKVSEGQMVSRGQNIGLSGDTGYTTAPHLHFSVRVGNSRVDPIVFIETTKKLNDNLFLADLTNAFLNFINQFIK